MISSSSVLSRPSVAGVLVLAVCLLTLSVGCNSGGTAGPGDAKNNSENKAAAKQLDLIQSVVSSEELILELTPKLKWLAKDLMNLTLPDERGKQLFAANVEITELGESTGTQPTIDNLSPVVDRHWNAGSGSTQVARESLSLWPRLIDQVEFFDHAKFYLIDGNFVDGDTTLFDSHMGFAALAKMKNGELQSLAGKLNVRWINEPDGPSQGCNDWQISKWELKSFHGAQAPQVLFDEVLATAIPDPSVRERATRSLHHEYFVDQFLKYVNTPVNQRTRIVEPYEYDVFLPDVTFEHPGVSVVDIDRDGWDDVYVCVMRGKNLMLRNRGDGTFEDIADSIGLGVEGGSTCAAFADFDNDGDYDMLLGRGRGQAKYFVNQDGMFEEDPSRFGFPLPYMVSSIAVADYNLDGLLDIYLGTYCPIEGGQGAAQNDNPIWAELFMTDEQKVELKKRARQAHRILDMFGPPNVLIDNVGEGKFELSKFNSQLESWKRCFQVAWSDYDHDGDPDVYLSNDYALDQLFRNDGDEGFVEVTKELKLDKLGFGMGVSWEDYNNDGSIDFYASNMFSKAGSRITRQIPGLDNRFKAMAYGNYLYQSERDGQAFKLMSGFAGEPMAVSKAGWSWGGQFTDFNNDGFQDLYVANGYHTAPKEISVDMDL